MTSEDDKVRFLEDIMNYDTTYQQGLLENPVAERREVLSCCHHQDDGLPMRRETILWLMIDVEVASMKRFCVDLEEVRKMLTADSDAAAMRLLLLL